MLTPIPWRPEWNLLAAWIGIGLGLVSGAAVGLGFHRDDWLGGYGSWRRRMIRLGHISFFGIALLNLAFFLTPGSDAVAFGGAALVLGAALMPTVCFLSAWRRAWRHAFVLPVLCLVTAAGLTTVHLLTGVLS